MRLAGRHLIAAGALALIASAALADVNAGVRAWQAGNFAAAVSEWRPLADKGDADAQYNLGQAYKLGRGVSADLGIAASWYQKAAQQGHAPAQANLALMLYTQGKKAASMPWMRKAADAGDPRCQFILGGELFNGDLIPEDLPHAYAYMSRAAAQGLPQAGDSLRVMDGYIPAAKRQEGVALAAQMEKAEGASTNHRRVLVATNVPTQLPPNSALQSTLPAPVPGRIASATPPAHPGTPSHAAPAPRPAAPRPAPIQASAGGGWKIQLGAFSSPANAHHAWETIKSKAGALSGLQPIFAAAGAVTRLQAGPLANRAAADRACAAAKGAGAACFPVAP